MNVAETELELFVDYQYVPRDDKGTVCFQTDDPAFDRQIWDQRFAFSGTRAEILGLCEQLMEFFGGDEPDADCRHTDAETEQAQASDRPESAKEEETNIKEILKNKKFIRRNLCVGCQTVLRQA